LVLDASAVLAFLHRETGWEKVRDALDGARISTVNWAEVAQKTLEKDRSPADVLAELRTLGIVLEPLTESQANQAARLRALTKHKGLSLGDRACLGLALDRSAPCMTADKAWSGLALGVEIILLR
jgi:PIN domain nuclease of toxin-antitoxin system